MRVVRVVPVLLGVALQVAAIGAAQDEGFTVVVNAANPVTSLPRAQVSRLFLKGVTEWPNGKRVIPVDLGHASTVRESFSLAIHGRKTIAVKSYWQRMIFLGSAVPAIELESDEAVLAFVRAQPRAVGYVSPGTPLPAEVKVLQISD